MGAFKIKIENKLKQLRLDHHLTQKQMGLKLHVSRKTVSSWEIGRNYPDIKTIIKISDLFNISTDQLLKNKNIVNYYDNKIREGKSKHKLQNIFFYITMILIILGYLELIAPSGFHFSVIGNSLIIDTIIVIIINTNNLKEYFFNNKMTIKSLLSFVSILFINSGIGFFRLISQNNIKKYDNSFIASMMTGRLALILAITISTMIVFRTIIVKLNIIKH